MKIRNFLPLLHIDIEIPLLSVTTEIMSEEGGKMERTYVVLAVKLWKWRFRFEVYDTYQRIHQRKVKETKMQGMWDSVTKGANAPNR